MSSSVACPCGSGKMFGECHGASKPMPLVTVVDKLPMAPAVVTRKLDLACGQVPKEGYEGVDFYAPNALHKVNLLRFPWPFEDNSVLELRCSHFIEHIPMIEVDPSGNQVPHGEGQDLLFKFFDECYRVLVPEGWIDLQWPSLRSDRAFQDPTHRRFIPEAMVWYLSKAWRESQKLDHYNVKCNFEGSFGQAYDSALSARVDEVRRLFIQNYWNGTIDFIAKLKAIKTPQEMVVGPGPVAVDMKNATYL
jgi:predicted SAM-dependent methyltransferase